MGACTAVGSKADLVSTTPLRSRLSPLVPCVATFALFPHPPVCAPPLSGAPETVTPSDTSMSVRGSGTSMSVCAANSSEKGEGGGRGFPPEGVLVVVPRRTSK